MAKTILWIGLLLVVILSTNSAHAGPMADAALKKEMGFNISICDADKRENKTEWHHLLWQGTKEDDATRWSEATLE